MRRPYALVLAFLVACGGSPSSGPESPSGGSSAAGASGAEPGALEAETCVIPEVPEQLRGALSAYTRGAYSEAEARATELERTRPEDRAAALLARASREALHLSASRITRTIGSTPAVRLAAIELNAPSVDQPEPRTPRLELEREERNRVTDIERWASDNGLSLPSRNADSELLPPSIGHARRHAVFQHEDQVIGAYIDGSLLVARAGAPLLRFDVSGVAAGAPVPLEVEAAELAGDTLYLQLAYNGYASQSGGHNGYLAAFDANTGAVRWVSAPLRGNLAPFVLSGQQLISGYGFTREDDFLYVTDADTGALVQRLPLASGPSLLLVHDGRLYVRTQDHNYVFAMSASTAPARPEQAATEPPDRALQCFAAQAFAALEAKDAARLRAVLATAPPGEEAERLSGLLRPLATGDALGLAGVDLYTVAPRTIAAPPWRRVPGTNTAPAGRPRLRRVSVRPADHAPQARAYDPTERWLIAPIQNGALPQGARSDIPSRYGGEDVRAILPSTSPRSLLLVYGGRYLAVIDEHDATEALLDLEAFRHPPNPLPQMAQFAVQDLTDAIASGDVVYLCNGGGSYAREVRGLKGFISAVSLETGALLWRSQPLVCNANIELVGDYLITGYGFTEEPDYLYIVRRSDGEVVHRAALRTGPESIEVEGSRVLVETYDERYEFELEGVD